MLIDKVKNHGRIKPKYSPKPNAAQQRFWDFVRTMGCLVCGQKPSIHHVISDGYKRLSKDHWHVTPLCPEHHQGATGIHLLGHNRFTRLHEINLHNAAFEILNLYKIAKDEQ